MGIDVLTQGKLINQPELKTSTNGNSYTNILLSVGIGESEPIVVSAIAFCDKAERLAKLGKGDSVARTGALKLSEWTDKATGEIRHGLSITVADVLSVYDIKKRRKPYEQPHQGTYQPPAPYDFDDRLPL